MNRLLAEKKIDPKRVKLVIDREDRTFQTAKNYRYKKLDQADSKNVIQIRLADFISGFVGRMMHALMNDPRSMEVPIDQSDRINREDLVDKRLLSNDWFILKREQFELYQLIYEVMIVNCQAHWSMMTLSYSDEVVCFYSLLRYINEYPDYEEFCAVSPELHTEYYNARCCDELMEYYSSM